MKTQPFVFPGTISNRIRRHAYAVFSPDSLTIKTSSNDEVVQLARFFSASLPRTFWEQGTAQATMLADEVYELATNDVMAATPTQRGELFVEGKITYQKLSCVNKFSSFKKRFAKAQSRVFYNALKASVPRAQGLTRARLRSELRRLQPPESNKYDLDNVVIAAELAERRPVALVSASQSTYELLLRARESSRKNTHRFENISLYKNTFSETPSL